MKTKSTFLIFAFSFLSFIQSNGQSFEKGQKDINLGIGIGTTYIGPNSHIMVPPLSSSFDYGITDDISIGAYLGFSASRWVYKGSEWCNNGVGRGNAYGNYYDYTDTYTWTFLVLGVRSAYHFSKLINIDNLDAYAGLMLGGNIANYNYQTTSICSDHSMSNLGSYGGFAYSVFAGGRYRFTEKFGVFSEVGYGVSFISLGVNFKL